MGCDSKEDIMIKVKTFTTPLKIFRAREELDEIDNMVNRFIQEHGISRVISVSDTCTSDDCGATIGIIRVLTYAE
jgi:hypothetical protein